MKRKPGNAGIMVESTTGNRAQVIFLPSIFVFRSDSMLFELCIFH